MDVLAAVLKNPFADLTGPERLPGARNQKRLLKNEIIVAHRHCDLERLGLLDHAGAAFGAGAPAVGRHGQQVEYAVVEGQKGLQAEDVVGL